MVVDYAPAETGEELYRAECDVCDDWFTETSLERTKAWAKRHVRHASHEGDEPVVVSIMKRLGWVA